MYAAHTALAAFLLLVDVTGGAGDACDGQELRRLQECVNSILAAFQGPVQQDVICTTEMKSNIECVAEVLQTCRHREDIARTHAKISPLLADSRTRLDDICKLNASTTTEIFDANASTRRATSGREVTAMAVLCVVTWNWWWQMT